MGIEMTLDLSSLKPGDKVRLRNGEIRTVTKIDKSDEFLPIQLATGNGLLHWYYADGKYYDDCDDPRDIEDIIEFGPEPEPMPTPSSVHNRVVTLDHDFFGFEHPDAINCNGKRYVPADSPSLFTGAPFALITRPGEGIIGIRYGEDDKLFTPADAWPEPIRDREPTEEDADPCGAVQWLVDEGWILDDWNIDRTECDGWHQGWQHTSLWKPKPKPAYSREELLELLRDSKAAAAAMGTDLRECVINEEAPDVDLLNSIITHLEATDTSSAAQSSSRPAPSTPTPLRSPSLQCSISPPLRR
jgi:hypothetical protein